MGALLVFFVIVSLGLVFRMGMGELDHNRIKTHIREQGGRVREIIWTPFGKGWFGSGHERIYEVRYTDSGGRHHRVLCKTGVLSGVYFTDDKEGEE